jgi:hypothetical protein
VRKGFERKFALDEEQRFKAMARRNKLLGLWAAEKLGKTGEDADAYAKEVVDRRFRGSRRRRRVPQGPQGFRRAGVEQSDHQIRRTMDELMATAVEARSRTADGNTARPAGPKPPAAGRFFVA